MFSLLSIILTILHAVATKPNLGGDLPEVVLRAVTPDFSYRQVTHQAALAHDYLTDLDTMANKILPTTRPAILYR